MMLKKAPFKSNLARALVIAAIMFVLEACVGHVTAEKVAGTYIARFGDQQFELTLAMDGTLKQTPIGSSKITARIGKWELLKQRVYLEGIQMEKDGFGRPLSQPEVISGSFPLDRGVNGLVIVFNDDLNFYADRKD